MSEIMPVPRNLILLSYQQGALPVFFVPLKKYFPKKVFAGLVRLPVFSCAGLLPLTGVPPPCYTDTDPRFCSPSAIGSKKEAYLS